ncbi:hypothetical protein BCR43DRAFT_503324 [Syncephalastrum racemosum]|uniref:Xylanolytic transcriptional activator regulatory domain-containing protein n=1 Tax=Syncephalastrum racemosum TaxID=13706 RepID=A0A1X2HHA3_SYNRA|nr:hypothetical protein BCR43DRAFT_503324 [Syncephalastrum racemosum]
MIAHDRASVPPTFAKTEDDKTIHHFLQEALQILRRANLAVRSNDDAEAETEAPALPEDDDLVWELHLSPGTITLDSNIQTVSSLEQVLEQLRVNIQPCPPSFRKGQGTNDMDRYCMAGFLDSVAAALYLSSAFPLPRADIFRQFNSMQLMRQCVQAFIMCDGAFYVHIPRLLADTDKVLSNANAFKEHPIESLLLLSICAVMIRHVTVHKRGHPSVAAGLMHAYHTHAKSLLQDLFDVHHLYVVQSLLMLSLYPRGHVDLFSPARTRSPLLSSALRMALAMDLHLIDSPASRYRDEDEASKEIARRLAWVILCADAFAEWNTAGRPGRIEVTDWQVDFPRPLAEERAPRRIEYFQQYCRIVMLRKMDLFRSAYHLVLRSPRALQSNMDEMLFDTYLNTPDAFRISFEENEQYTKNDIESLLLQTLHMDTLIATFIPFLPPRYLVTLDRERDSREACMADIYHHVVQSAKSNTPFYLSSQQSKKDSLTLPDHSAQLEITIENVEFRSVVGCLSAASQYTRALEILATLDEIGCHYSPVYGALTTAHVYHMLEGNCQDPQVRMLCQINLVRTRYILQQARAVFADSAILYLERILPRWITIGNENKPPQQLHHQAGIVLASLRERMRVDENSDIKLEPA